MLYMIVVESAASRHIPGHEQDAIIPIPSIPDPVNITTTRQYPGVPLAGSTL